MQRVAVLLLTLALTAVAALSQAGADDFPSRPIRLIIGFPPGSAADITARWSVAP
jgi:tripartite-type tricarboxylate transporter receptor subunit TctC